MGGSRLGHRATALAVLMCTVVAAAGCTSNSSPSAKSTYPDLGPGVRARVTTLQLVIDTGQPTDQPLGPDMVVNGIVVYNADFQSWFGTGQNGVLAPGVSTSLANEAVKAQALINRVPPLTTASAAHAVIATELLDAGLLTASDLHGTLDANGTVTVGPAVESWYAAHAAAPLAKGASVTLSTEADRVTAEIEKPE